MSRTTNRSAFSLIEMLVAFAIIAVLVGMLLPSVQKVREAAALLQCKNNLHQQGIALHTYYTDHSAFPPAKINSGLTLWYNNYPTDFWGRPIGYSVLNLTGFTLLLPYLDQSDLYNKYDPYIASCIEYAGGVNSAPFPAASSCPGNIEVVSTYIPAYHCPADTAPAVDAWTSTNAIGSDTPAQRTSYLMNIYHHHWEYFGGVQDGDSMWTVFHEWPRFQGAFLPQHARTMGEFTDGMGYTIAIGECKQVNGGHYYGAGASMPSASHWGAGHEASMTGAMYGRDADYFPGSDHINFPSGQLYGLSPSDPNYNLQRPMGFGSWHPAGANFLFVDGSVRFLPNSMSFPVFDALGTANSGTVEYRLDGTRRKKGLVCDNTLEDLSGY